MGTPDWNAWLAGVWGPSTDGVNVPPVLAALASNVVTGSNPPYTIQDFFTQYPKFAGSPLLSGNAAPTATLTSGSTQISVNKSDGMVIGQPIAGPGIPDNTFIAGIAGLVITLTNPATQTAAGVPILVWNATSIPPSVILAYIALATAHLVQARWQDTWTVAMGLFVAHFCTLYARSDGNPNANIGQIASQGLAFGIQVAKNAGDLSVSYSPVGGIDSWGSFNLTSYGQQLVTFAKSIGAGPMLLW